MQKKEKKRMRFYRKNDAAEAARDVTDLLRGIH